ncbi:LysM peptidoglycan-binding domain-containing protein [Planomicrobium sp. Y74]|nr:LysM peptidoglycan-binding domain-containing protein [Planomicrobium sp. Y74]
MTVNELKKLNPSLNPYALQIGAEVVISQERNNPNGSVEKFHMVQPGETLYSIANLHAGVTLDDLYDWNPGIDPYNLQIGSDVRVQAPDNTSVEVFHMVQPGETLYSIANLHAGVTLDDLYDWNPGIDPYNLQIGSDVRVQAPDNTSVEVFHMVQPGETLYSIANLHAGVTLDDLYDWNPGIDPYNLQIGSDVRVAAPQ